jgi:C-terminal processing protease CtpA/Prc
MLETLAAAEAIVFDLRGYPKGTAWALAPRLRTRPSDAAALFSRRLVGHGQGEESEGSFTFVQPLPPAAGPIWRGRSVMLIDERTISQGEHTGLFLEAANDTAFVGTPSAGANGDVTWLTLPGGLTVSFTGHDVRHADGRQLQRMGLQPQLRAAPTIRGIRAGRDEVLEAAMGYLGSTGKTGE